MPVPGVGVQRARDDRGLELEGSLGHVSRARLEARGLDYGISVFGLVAAAAYFIPGWKYYRQGRRQESA